MFTKRTKELLKDISKYLTENKVTYNEFHKIMNIIEENYKSQLFKVKEKLIFEYVLRYDFETIKDSNKPSQ